jgi:GNAT superfamily N-acetyltransferase
MAVVPEWQGTGLAADLLHRAEAERSNLGCVCMTLKTTRPLRRAARFYRKCGYRPSGRRSDFFGMPVLEYVKRLAPAREAAARR